MSAFLFYVNVQLPLLFLFYTTSLRIYFIVLLFSLTQGTRFSTFETSCSVTWWNDRVSSKYWTVVVCTRITENMLWMYLRHCVPLAQMFVLPFSQMEIFSPSVNDFSPQVLKCLFLQQTLLSVDFFLFRFTPEVLVVACRYRKAL